MKAYVLPIFIFFMGFVSWSQVGIGTNTPNAAAVLELSSTDKGFLPPRLTVTQMGNISNPPEGLMVYCTDCPIKGMYYFDGTDFKNFTSGDSLNFNEVNALIQIGNEADDPDTVNSVITVAQLNSITGVTAVTGYDLIYQDYIDGNPDLFSSPATVAEVQAMMSAVVTNNTVVSSVLNPTTGETWMDRNLGATRVATASNDNEAYGHLFQWGRAADGHEYRYSPVTAGPVTSGNEGSNFVSSNVVIEHTDWLSASDDSRWQTEAEANNPCPSGYRVTTMAEIEAERQSWSSNDIAGAYASSRKFTFNGFRYNTGDIVLAVVGTLGYYWTSTIQGTERARRLEITSSGAGVGNSGLGRAFGFAVRCIQE